jgi:hypothetical protein
MNNGWMGMGGKSTDQPSNIFEMSQVREATDNYRKAELLSAM